MNISKTGLTGIAAAAILVLGACGASGSSSEGSASAPVSSASAESSSSAQPSSSETSSSSTSKGSESSTPAEDVAITIKDFKFQTPKSVAPGAKITVTNKDSATHTVTADEGDAFDVTVPGNGTATFTAPAKPGTSAFHCTFHSQMKGSLVVKK